MAISHKDIARSIYKGSKDHQGDESSYYKDVVRFLNKRRLLSKSPSILAHLKKIINTEQGILEAKVSTAVRLGATERYTLIQELKTRYKAKDVALQEVINESLLGGMRVEVGDEVIDLSTKGKILKLQTYLMRSV